MAIREEARNRALVAERSRRVAERSRRVVAAGGRGGDEEVKTPPVVAGAVRKLAAGAIVVLGRIRTEGVLAEGSPSEEEASVFRAAILDSRDTSLQHCALDLLS